MTSVPDERPAPTRDGTFVQSLDRGLAVIRAFDAEHPRLQLSEVARATGLTRAAARRFLLTLVQLGYVRAEGREFSLRPRVLELGYSYLSGLTLPEVAQPHLEALVQRVEESSSLSVLDGDDVVYVARVHTKRIMTVMITVGTRFPAYATSMGRVLLAGLPDDELDAYLDRARLEPLTGHTVTDPGVLRKVLDEVRERGFAMVDQELEEGLRSAAAPVRDRSGAVVAAVNLSVSASRTSPAQLEHEYVPPLLETAAQIGHDLGRSTRS
ncbi:IclR family transcriptional regulator C-terminal domain-containing protein [Blastococcus sp. BMG 814]|uniref:IclR family transcriptional regulator C-terminal domain-containing protein n=1 Tax=Blastococcus carthaginiensis TaxID=3050034 RepID=A0ABT9IGG1_9ACTN|nr:IclR family transcriptional regulator C-terminal domain-containing protein [Blastococcus carthaginiensis]MDP5184667.1 IclR family transcriptional regulator C-terminal domain-containing protein [Blastococcus carthaginiensis]